MEIKEFKPGDYCRFSPEEIPSIIALLKANGWKIWDRQDERYTQRDVIILFSRNNGFVSVVGSHIGLETEIHRHDFMVTALRLNEGDGMRSDMSTPEQRKHISVTLEKLGVKQFSSRLDKDVKHFDCGLFLLSGKCWAFEASDIEINHIDYLDWCKRLNVTPIGDEQVVFGNSYISEKYPKDLAYFINHIPDVGENVFEHTIDNPLGLTWDGVDYRVNKPNVDSGKFVELEYAKSLLNKQILQLPDGTTVDLKRLCMGIINQLFDLAEVPVEKRQSINDAADEYLIYQLNELINNRNYTDYTTSVEEKVDFVIKYFGLNPNISDDSSVIRTEIGTICGMLSEYDLSIKVNKSILTLPNGKKVEVTNPSEIPDDGVEWLTASLPLDPITYKHIHNKPEEVKVDRMDNYAIQLLQKALNDELKHLVISKEMTQGNGFKFDNATMSAFDESRKIAEDRIPQLKEAIQKLTA